MNLRLPLLLSLACVMSMPAFGAPQKVILDTDIGDDIDDAYAVALITSLPDVKLLGVTPAYHETTKRAPLAAKLLKAFGKGNVPVYAGRETGAGVGPQCDWAKNYKSNMVHLSGAVEFMKKQIDAAPGEITIIAVGPLTNLGDLFTKYPDVKQKIKGIAIMGGAVLVGYSNKPPIDPEWNIKCDPAAAKAVYTSGVPLVMAGLEVTTMLQLGEDRQKQIYAKGSAGTDALAALTAIWGNHVPTLYDPMAIAYGLGHKFCESEKYHVEVSDDGFTRITPGEPNVTVLVKPDKEGFLNWYVKTVLEAK